MFKFNNNGSRLGGSRTRIAAVTFAALLIPALAASAAQACSYPSAQQVFKPWSDQHSYELIGDGGFESGATGWKLSGGAKAVAGNESFFIHKAADRNSLSLPVGSTAASPPVCMAIDTPVYRLMARNTGASSSRLRVEAVYNVLGLNLVNTKTVSTISAGSAWSPTAQLSTVLTLSPVVGTLIPSSVQIRLTPQGAGGQWQVDDVYVDPYARH